MGGLKADETVVVEARIAEELLRLTRGRRVGSQVVPPAPYVHAVEHAAAGQMLDERYLSAEFLPFVDAARLRPLVAHRQRDKQGSPADRSCGGVASRGARVELGFARCERGRAGFLVRRVGEPSDESAAGGLWRTQWGWCRAGSGEILGRHTRPVVAMATVVLPDGRPVAVTGSWDGAVRIWDLTTGAAVGEPLTGHTKWVVAVATVVLPDGRPVAVTGSEDATVRIWDLTTGAPVGEPLTGHGAVMAVAAVVLLDGRPVAVTGEDATVRIWDLASGAPVGDPLTGHTEWVVAVATVVLPDGRPVAVTGSFDATVRIWDLAVPGAVGHPLHVTAAVHGVAMCRSERDVIAVIVGDGVARVDVEVGAG